eukprot:7910108-Alexandrium_andersonii.AAC.1
MDSVLARQVIEAAGGDAARVADVRRLLAQARTGDPPGRGDGVGRAREPGAESPAGRLDAAATLGPAAPARAAEQGQGTTLA